MRNIRYFLVLLAVFSLIAIATARAANEDALIIVNTNDITETKQIVEFIRAHGGIVTQVIIPNSIFAIISEEQEKKLLDEYPDKIIRIARDNIDIAG